MSGQLPKEFWAHSPVNDGDPGLLPDHLQEVGGKAREFAMHFGAGEMAQAAGLLHDIGKYSDKFQRLVRGEKIRAPHSAFGAQEAAKQWPNYIGQIIAWCVAGHHAGLANHQELQQRLQDPAPDASEWKNHNINLPQNPALPEFMSEADAFSAQFFIRMIFSCLVDADRLAAEKHFNPDSARARKNRPTIPQLRDELNAHLQRQFNNGEQNEVNKLRAEVLAACRETAECPPGFFSLSVPTGGGKTLSSLAFALTHAGKNNMRRVVCAIPFTSIIEQNADVFRKALGESAVLEHHCNYEPKSGDGHPDENRLSAENWDKPVVAATNLQLFESLFAARASRCRKLHNLAQSVIVLDEAQALPANLLRPCVRALDELVKNYGASVVFCTATLPDFNQLLKQSDSAKSAKEIIPDPKALHDKLKRVRIEPPDAKEWTPDSLAGALAETKSVLCVVNTRRQALETFAALCEKTKPDERFHLSTWMHPNHRTAALNAIRNRLNGNAPCKVVSTTLVEAGVDLDFPEVWRAAAGLDSVAQAAGRCNREGNMKAPGRVVVFRMAGGHADDYLWQENGLCAEAMKSENPLAPEVVREYFSAFHRLLGREKTDNPAGKECRPILSSIREAGRRFAFPFKTIEECFRMIEGDAVPIVIPADGGKTVAEKLKDGENIGHWARKAQRWSASVSPGHAKKLEAQGFVDRVGPDGQFLVLKNPAENYDGRVGGLGLGKLMIESGL